VKQTLQRVDSKHSHLYLYLSRETLFVWSTLKKELLALEGVHAALFFYMEEHDNSEDIYNYVKIQGIPHSQELEKVINTIDALFQTKKKKEATQSFSIESSLQQKEMQQTPLKDVLYYKLNDNASFSLSIEDKSIEKEILTPFKHLQIDKHPIDLAFFIDVKREDNHYEILLNGEKDSEVYDKKHLVPLLYDLVRIHYYQTHDFLVAMHAAALTYKGHLLILPGTSGVGKSTLASYLMYNGFKLYSDELTVINSQNEIVPLPLCSTIKEGSWEFVSGFMPTVNTLEHHLRFDKQKIKYVVPPSIAYKEESIQNSCILFPQYKKGSQTLLNPLSTVEALALLINSQYHLIDPKNFDKVYEFLLFISNSKLLRLTYCDADEALNILEKEFSL